MYLNTKYFLTYLTCSLPTIQLNFNIFYSYPKRNPSAHIQPSSRAHQKVSEITIPQQRHKKRRKTTLQCYIFCLVFQALSPGPASHSANMQPLRPSLRAPLNSEYFSLAFLRSIVNKYDGGIMVLRSSQFQIFIHRFEYL